MALGSFNMCSLDTWNMYVKTTITKDNQQYTVWIPETHMIGSDRYMGLHTRADLQSYSFCTHKLLIRHLGLLYSYSRWSSSWASDYLFFLYCILRFSQLFSVELELNQLLYFVYRIMCITQLFSLELELNQLLYFVYYIMCLSQLFSVELELNQLFILYTV